MKMEKFQLNVKVTQFTSFVTLTYQLEVKNQKNKVELSYDEKNSN
jgi:hypothetical protein